MRCGGGPACGCGLRRRPAARPQTRARPRPVPRGLRRRRPDRGGHGRLGRPPRLPLSPGRRPVLAASRRGRPAARLSRGALSRQGALKASCRSWPATTPRRPSSRRAAMRTRPASCPGAGSWSQAARPTTASTSAARPTTAHPSRAGGSHAAGHHLGPALQRARHRRPRRVADRAAAIVAHLEQTDCGPTCR